MIRASLQTLGVRLGGMVDAARAGFNQIDLGRLKETTQEIGFATEQKIRIAGEASGRFIEKGLPDAMDRYLGQAALSTKEAVHKLPEPVAQRLATIGHAGHDLAKAAIGLYPSNMTMIHEDMLRGIEAWFQSGADRDEASFHASGVLNVVNTAHTGQLIRLIRMSERMQNIFLPEISGHADPAALIKELVTTRSMGESQLARGWLALETLINPVRARSIIESLRPLMNDANYNEWQKLVSGTAASRLAIALA